MWFMYVIIALSTSVHHLARMMKAMNDKELNVYSALSPRSRQ